MLPNRALSLPAIARTLVVAFASILLLSACPTTSSKASDRSSPGARLVGAWEIAPDLHPAWIEHVRKNGPQPDPGAAVKKLGHQPTTLTFTADGSMTISQPSLGKNWDKSSSYSVVEDSPGMIRVASPDKATGSTSEGLIYFIDADTIRMGKGDDATQYTYWRRLK